MAVDKCVLTWMNWKFYIQCISPRVRSLAAISPDNNCIFVPDMNHYRPHYIYIYKDNKYRKIYYKIYYKDIIK